MALKFKSLKYFFLVNLGLLIADKTFSPDVKSYASEELISEINKMAAEEKRRKKIIEELEKPVLYFCSPVDAGQVSCLYGYRKNTAEGEKEFHNGIDIGIIGNASLKFAKRPDILAAATGIVSFAGNKAGYGKVVKIKHGGNLETIYAHLNRFFVEKGDSILSQEKIGEMGKSGNARSDKKFGQKLHLHFEAQKNDRPFNPAKFFFGHKKLGIDDTLYAKNLISTKELNHNLFTENIEKPAESKSKKENPEEMHYSVQIAASQSQFSKNKIKRFQERYGSNLNEIVYENGKEKIYKYSFGNFRTLEEAAGSAKTLESKFNKNFGVIVYKGNKILETRWD